MKLLFITDPLVTTIGGATKPALLLAKQMQTWGHSVEISSLQFTEPIVSLLNTWGIQHTQVRSHCPVVRSYPTLEAWAKSLVRPTKTVPENADTWVVNTSSCVIADSSAYYGQGTMTSALDAISRNFPLLSQYAYEGLAPWLKLLERRLVQRFEESAERFVVNSAFCASIYRKWGINVDRVIYPPLDTELFKASTLEPSEDFVLTHIGTFGKESDPLLIRRIAALGVRIKIFGDISNIRKTQTRNITFLGKVADEELVNLYSNALFTLFAFNHEPFGYAPVESMACGTPVLTFNRQGPGETVIDSRTGWLTETDEEFVQKAAEIWRQRTVDKSMRDQCREAVLKYDVKRISKEWIDFLKRN